MKFWGTRRQSPMDSFWNTLTVWHWLRSCEGHQGFWAGTQQNDWHHAATQPLWMWTLQSSKKHHSTDTEQYWGRKLCVLCESIWEAWGLNLQNKLSQLSHRETWKNQSPKKCHQWSSVIISDHQWSLVISDEYTYIYIYYNIHIYIYIRYLRITPATCCHACPKVPWWQLNQQLSLPAEPHRTAAPLRTSPWSNGASAHLASMSTTPPKGTERDWNTHGYGSIPIDTFLVGWTSINPSYDLGWTKGTRVLTHPHIKHESNTWTYSHPFQKTQHADAPMPSFLEFTVFEYVKKP